MKYVSSLRLGFLSSGANTPGPLYVAPVGFGRPGKSEAHAACCAVSNQCPLALTQEVHVFGQHPGKCSSTSVLDS